MNDFKKSLYVIHLTLILGFLVLGCNKEKSRDDIKETTTTVGEEPFVETNWNVKARLPNNDILDVKAIDKDGNIFDVKAVQNTEQISIIDVKAFVNGNVLPVKILTSNETIFPVKAIHNDGTILDIKAITNDGKKFEVKGVFYSGNIIHIKAINPNGDFYGIEAISPKGWINDVMGIKMFDSPVEGTINGKDIFAHIKSIPRSIKEGPGQ